MKDFKDKNEKFRNYVFISYSRKDSNWSRWLQNRLENYNLRKLKISAEIQPLEYIRPVFRDSSDIGIGELKTNLVTELEASRFLIVICSASTTEPDGWVNKEVGIFNKLHGGGKIIPFIIEGSPQPKDNNEFQCYPPELDKNILGASLTELTKEAALIKIISFIVGLKFDELWQRHRRREKKRKRIVSWSIIAGIFVIAIFTSILLRDIKQNKINLFLTDIGQKEFIGRNPESIKKLDLSVLNDSIIPKPIAFFKNIDTLIIFNNSHITRINNISHLKNLKILSITNVGMGLLKSIAGMENLPGLEELIISGNNIGDWGKISDLKNIKKLYIHFANLKTLKPLSKLKKLESLNINPNAFPFNADEIPRFDLRELGNMPNLKKLSLSECNITSIGGLKNKEVLDTLDISNNLSITDIDSIGSFKNVKYLDLSKTNFSNFSLLSGLTQLHYLDISLCSNISDLDSLTNLQMLGTLHISFAGFSKAERKKLIPALQKLHHLQELLMDEQLALDLGGVKKLNDVLSNQVKIRLINGGSGR